MPYVPPPVFPPECVKGRMIDPSPVVDLIDAFRRSKVMFVALSMGVFERLYGKSADVAALAAELNSNPDALERLLDGCVGLGLLQKNGSAYTNAPSPTSTFDAIAPIHSAVTSAIQIQPYTKCGGNLEQSGPRRASSMEGNVRRRRPVVLAHFFKNEESKRDFLAGMNGFGMVEFSGGSRGFRSRQNSGVWSILVARRSPANRGMPALSGSSCGGVRSSHGDSGRA